MDVPKSEGAYDEGFHLVGPSESHIERLDAKASGLSPQASFVVVPVLILAIRT